MNSKVLVLPGWQRGASAHWPRHWAQRHGHTLVDAHDGMRPRRGDWLARLDEVVVDTPGAGAEIVLLAHGLASVQVAAWAAVSRHTARVAGALLVGVTDVERADLREQLPGWAPMVRQRLPFAATLVASRQDPHCSAERAQALARDWGADWLERELDLNGAGPEIQALLQSLQSRQDAGIHAA